MIVGTAWEYSAQWDGTSTQGYFPANSAGSLSVGKPEFGVLFIPHTGGNKTTTDFTMSLIGTIGTAGVFYTNFQVLGY
jgi:hypothetical protein